MTRTTIFAAVPWIAGLIGAGEAVAQTAGKPSAAQATAPDAGAARASVVAEYQALAAAGGSILGRRIAEVLTVNGVRVTLEDGSWLLVRASSNKPELVVVVESTRSEDDMRALFHAEVKPRMARHPEVGAYNQEI